MPPHPSPPHRKPQGKSEPSRTKRVNVVSTDGWTHVTRKGPQHHKGLRVIPSPTRSPLVPAEIPDGFTLQRLSEEYQRYNAIWAGSSCCREVDDILSNMLQAGANTQNEGFELEDCVCLGLGSMTDPVSRRLALFQLAALKSCLETIRKISGKSPRTYIQDPVFSSLDIEFLQLLDLTVLESPGANDKISPQSFLYAPHCERSFFLPALRGKAPGLCICNDMSAILDGLLATSLTEQEQETVRTFTKGRTSKAFPLFDECDTAFNDMRIYSAPTSVSTDSG